MSIQPLNTPPSAGPGTPANTATSQSRNPRRDSRLPSIVIHVLLIAGAAAMLYPLVWMIGASLKSPDEIFGDAGLLPSSFEWSNYTDGWSVLGVTFGRFFLNSFVISTLSVIGNVVTCSMAAYAFARLQFRFKKMWFTVMMATMMLPMHVLIVPQYVLFNNLDWINTFLPLTVPHFLAVDAFFIFLMVQFIRSIPPELDDAAKIDGAGPFQIYFRIILPLLSPALVTTAIFTFIWTWDNLFPQLIFLQDMDKFTVPLGLNAFLDSTGSSSWGPMFAMATLALVPIFVIFFVFQKRLAEGIATTGLKS